MIVVSETRGETEICPGDSESVCREGDRRSEAKYREALRQLAEAGYVEFSSELLLEVTHSATSWLTSYRRISDRRGQERSSTRTP